MTVAEVDAYLAALEEPKRSTLTALRRSIMAVVPNAEQGMSYGMPAFRVDGKVVAGFAASDLVHIAAHGRHRGDNPLFSAVWLEGGSLFAHEFEGRPRRASHVVLSACSAGGATLRPGDEPLGFASALLAYGVGTVVAPVSDVPDDTARRTMTLYHDGLATGREASVALAEAVSRAASEGHWLAGSFTCFGAPWLARGLTEREAAPEPSAAAPLRSWSTA